MPPNPLPTAPRDAPAGAAAFWRAALAVALLTGIQPAWAYIDPNAGGWLYQLLFPLLVGIGALWAGLRLRIRAWWHRLRHGKAPAPGSDDAGDA